MTLGRMKQSKDETAHHADRYPSPSTSPPPPWGRLPTLVPVPCFLKTFAIGSFLVLSVLLLMEFDCLESRGERGCSGYRVGHLLGCDQHSWGGRGQLLGQVGQLFESGRQPLVFRQRQSQRRWHKDCHKVYLDQHFRMILFCFLAARPPRRMVGVNWRRDWESLGGIVGEPPLSTRWNGPWGCEEQEQSLERGGRVQFSNLKGFRSNLHFSRGIFRGGINYARGGGLS